MSAEENEKAFADLKEARDDIFKINGGIKEADRARNVAVMSADMKALSKADSDMENLGMQLEPAQKALKESEAAVKKSSADRIKYTKEMESAAQTLGEVREDEKDQIEKLRDDELALAGAKKAVKKEKIAQRADDLNDKVNKLKLEVKIDMLRYAAAETRGEELSKLDTESRKVTTPDDEEIPEFKDKTAQVAFRKQLTADAKTL